MHIDWLGRAAGGPAEETTGTDLTQFFKDEFDAFLECGILAHGFSRLCCGDCGHDKLLAFSCKRGGFHPSCGVRRMAQTAAHLMDHVFPHPPVHRWQIDCQEPDVRGCRIALHCRDWSRSVADIQPEPQVPRKLSGRTSLSAVTRLVDLLPPDLPFKAALEGRQYAANFGGSNIRDRPATVAYSRWLQGELKTIAAILEQPVIDKIFTHLGLQARAPPRAPARGEALQGD